VKAVEELDPPTETEVAAFASASVVTFVLKIVALDCVDVISPPSTATSPVTVRFPVTSVLQLIDTFPPAVVLMLMFEAERNKLWGVPLGSFDTITGLEVSVTSIARPGFELLSNQVTPE
jgi:hypothetical protein